MARRALKTINFKEEGERLNVWIAMLNLENNYGGDVELDKVRLGYGTLVLGLRGDAEGDK